MIELPQIGAASGTQWLPLRNSISSACLAKSLAKRKQPTLFSCAIPPNLSVSKPSSIKYWKNVIGTVKIVSVLLSGSAKGNQVLQDVIQASEETFP